MTESRYAPAVLLLVDTCRALNDHPEGHRARVTLVTGMEEPVSLVSAALFGREARADAMARQIVRDLIPKLRAEGVKLILEETRRVLADID